MTDGDAAMSKHRWATYHHQDMGWYVARSDIDTDSQAEARALYVFIEASANELRDYLNEMEERLTRAEATIDLLTEYGRVTLDRAESLEQAVDSGVNSGRNGN